MKRNKILSAWIINVLLKSIFTLRFLIQLHIKKERSLYFYLTRHMFVKLLSNTRYNLIEQGIRLRVFVSSER